MSTTIRQVNNLKIKFYKLYGAYFVVTPDGRLLEQFEKLDDAIRCAKGITDFIVKFESEVKP